MFDTSVVRSRAIAAPRSTTLAISLAAHSVAVVAAIVLSVSSTRIPADPPRQLELYRPVEFPSAPPPPPALGRQPEHAATPAPRQQQVVTPAQPVAPQAIPDQVPAVTDSAASSLQPGSGDPTGATGPVGDPNGVPGGVPGGQPGGTGSATQVGPYTPGVGGVTQAHVLTRVEPRFPQSLIGGVRSTLVVVHCVIGKDGRIHDPQIIVSSFEPFNEAVLQALRQWTFAPGTMNGEPVDTYFQLTVKFEVKR